MADALAAASGPSQAPGRDDPTIAMPVAPRASSPTPTALADRLTPPLGWRAPAQPTGRAERGARAAARLRGRRRAWWGAGLALCLAALLALPLVVSKQRDDSSSSRAGGAPPASATTKESGSGATLSSTRVRVPALAGERSAVAIAKLRSLDLRSEVRFVNAGRDQRGRVVAEDPPAGTTVERGTTVRLLIGGRGSGKGRDKGEG